MQFILVVLFDPNSPIKFAIIEVRKQGIFTFDKMELGNFGAFLLIFLTERLTIKLIISALGCKQLFNAL